MHKLNASKNADIEHLIDILQSTERKQLQQTPSFKIGGGGARAARRIRIRRPLLAERGCRACRTLCQKSADSKASYGPRPARKPSPENPAFSILPTLRRQNLNFRSTFCRSKIHQKSDSSKTRPKSQKANPESQNADFGWISGAILASLLLLFPSFCRPFFRSRFGIDFGRISDHFLAPC